MLPSIALSHIHDTCAYTDGVAQNRNIIMHLLSQVRIGMDLSRVRTSVVSYCVAYKFLWSNIFVILKNHVFVHKNFFTAKDLSTRKSYLNNNNYISQKLEATKIYDRKNLELYSITKSSYFNGHR